MDVQREVMAIVDRVLDLRGRASTFDASTRLLGNVPELDSMAVANIITSLEERFGFDVADDEIDGTAFATIASLTEFVSSKLHR